MNIRDNISSSIKGITGLKTSRKLVVLAFDDYGNMRARSAKAIKDLKRRGFSNKNRFDNLDSLSTREDLEQLFRVLRSVKDSKGHTAIITALSVPCNINFQAVSNTGYTRYIYEELPETYRKMEEEFPSQYRGAWDLWQQGIQERLLSPEFHGREHLNVHRLEKVMQEQPEKVKPVIDSGSYIFLPKGGDYHTAFAGADVESITRILTDGVKRFKNAFGTTPVLFTPPGLEFPANATDLILNSGFKMWDTPFFNNGKIYRTHIDSKNGLMTIVRNAMFEPLLESPEAAVKKALQQVSVAFKCYTPAIISSHRVNFSGNIDTANRTKGLETLKHLLTHITERWPEVEFIDAKMLYKYLS